MLLTLGLAAQGLMQYDNIPLKTANDCRKAEPQVMLAADYVYSSSIDKKDKNREGAIGFIMRWMNGTGDYSFVRDETVMRVCCNEKELIGIYMACTAKYALSKGKAVDREDLKINSFLLLAKYCENPANNCKPHGELKKLIEAKNRNQLKEFLEPKQK